MEEKRWNMRVPTRLPVAMEIPGIAALTGIARDISFEGMYVRVSEWTDSLQPTLMVLVSLPTSEHADCHIELPGSVVRTTLDGVGVRLFDYGDREFKNIAEHVAAGFTALRRRTSRRTPESRRFESMRSHTANANRGDSAREVPVAPPSRTT